MRMDRTGERALIVDDDPGLRRLFQRYFHSLGWTADAVSGGLEALEAFGAATYRVVVCDVNLGAGDGIQTAKKLRDMQPSLRVVIASGLPDNIDRARAAGFGHCLRKPFTLDELKTAIGGA